MHPNRELTQLAAHKAAQRQAIARQRLAVAAECDAITQPLRWLARLRGPLRQITLAAPFVFVAISHLARHRRTYLLRHSDRLRRWTRFLRCGVRGLNVLISLRAAVRPNPRQANTPWTKNAAGDMIV